MSSTSGAMLLSFVLVATLLATTMVTADTVNPELSDSTPKYEYNNSNSGPDEPTTESPETSTSDEELEKLEWNIVHDVNSIGQALASELSVRLGFEKDGIWRMLLGLDGAPSSTEVLEAAESWLKSRGGSLRGVGKLIQSLASALGFMGNRFSRPHIHQRTLTPDLDPGFEIRPMLRPGTYEPFAPYGHSIDNHNLRGHSHDDYNPRGHSHDEDYHGPLWYN